MHVGTGLGYTVLKGIATQLRSELPEVEVTLNWDLEYHGKSDLDRYFGRMALHLWRHICKPGNSLESIEELRAAILGMRCAHPHSVLVYTSADIKQKRGETRFELPIKDLKATYCLRSTGGGVYDCGFSDAKSRPGRLVTVEPKPMNIYGTTRESGVVGPRLQTHFADLRNHHSKVRVRAGLPRRAAERMPISIVQAAAEACTPLEGERRHAAERFAATKYKCLAYRDPSGQWCIGYIRSVADAEDVEEARAELSDRQVPRDRTGEKWVWLEYEDAIGACTIPTPISTVVSNHMHGDLYFIRDDQVTGIQGCMGFELDETLIWAKCVHCKRWRRVGGSPASDHFECVHINTEGCAAPHAPLGRQRKKKQQRQQQAPAEG